MMSKKILAILLSLSMIGSAVGMPVFADEIEAETAEVLEIVEAEETEEVSILSEEDESVSEETEDYNIRLMANEATYYSEYGVYFDKSTGTITDADVKFTNFNIPEKIDGTFVTAIGERAFADCILATNITMPNTIEKIGYRAFENCTSLTELTIPPYADTSGYSYYYGNWIYGCTKLKMVNIAEGATKIPFRAFATVQILIVL